MDQLELKDVILAQHTSRAGWNHDVAPGRPVAQLYGLGTGWRDGVYNLEEICGKGSPCTKVSSQDAWRYFTMGPPIFMTMADWRKIAEGWYNYLPVIRRKHKVSAVL